MKFVSISDTHGKHALLTLPAGEVLIHAGDVSSRGDKSEIINFLTWFGNQNYKHKIFIAGNHDFYFERESDENIENIIPEGIIYLKDSGVIINNIHIWGSPITPWFFNWAFNRYRGEQIRRHWEIIPQDTDILITHGPVAGVLDKTRGGQHAGCEDLLKRIQEINIKIHICGHIHEGYGMVDQAGVKFINASVVNERYELVNSAVEFDL